MICRSGDMNVEVREQMRGGEGSVVIRRVKEALLPGRCRLFGELTLEPGCSIGEHTHTGEAEAFYFLQGEGTVTDDGETIPVRAGDAMITPSGHSHSVANTGTGPLVIAAVIIRD